MVRWYQFKTNLKLVLEDLLRVTRFVIRKIATKFSNSHQLRSSEPNKVYLQINQKLKDIGAKLELSRPLNLGSARDCYANTLDKNNTDIKKISQMLGHSNVVITEHYLAGLNPDVTFGINDPIL